MPTALVTGANAGIGNAFANVLLSEGYKVYAIDRTLGDGLRALKGAHIEEVDVTSPESISKFKLKLGDEPLDLMLHNAGTYQCSIQGNSDQSGIAFPKVTDTLENATLEVFQKTFAVNTYGTFLVTQALLPNVLSSDSPRISFLTSRAGSIGDNTSGNTYAYRSSKAAANSIARSIAMNLKDKGVVVTVLHPGLVRTNLLPDDDGPEYIDPDEAATKLWKNIISQKTIEDTGKFWHREGHELPW